MAAPNPKDSINVVDDIDTSDDDDIGDLADDIQVPGVPSEFLGCFQVHNYQHVQPDNWVEGEWQLANPEKMTLVKHDPRAPAKKAREDKVDGRAQGGRGVSGAYHQKERFFVVVSRMAYGSDGGNWKRTEEGLADYLKNAYPQLYKDLPRRKSSSVSERWHQQRKGVVVETTLEHTWRAEFNINDPEWAKEMQLIQEAGFLEEAKWPADWESRDANASYKKRTAGAASVTEDVSTTTQQ
ncbi:hypothetical protein ABW21_db0209173 [Orbilia brochopaga]|nr:hypothetical protein ABW21_db0209173 [Drechslerella brochopaga]